jgi:hypothetical protein
VTLRRLQDAMDSLTYAEGVALLGVWARYRAPEKVFAGGVDAEGVTQRVRDTLALAARLPDPPEEVDRVIVLGLNAVPAGWRKARPGVVYCHIAGCGKEVGRTYRDEHGIEWLVGSSKGKTKPLTGKQLRGIRIRDVVIRLTAPIADEDALLKCERGHDWTFSASDWKRLEHHPT